MLLTSLLMLAIVLAGPAGAGSIAVSPLRLQLTGENKLEELRVTNTSNEPSFLQVLAVEWAEADRINSSPIAAKILAVPPVFELAPGEVQLVRIAPREITQDGPEQAYRLLVTEVPQSAGLVPNSLAIAGRINLPLFVTPEGASPQPYWSMQGGEVTAPKLALSNRGDAHLSIKRIVMTGDLTVEPLFQSNDGGFVLPGAKKTWTLDADLARLKGPFTVKAETNIGPLEALVAFPGR
jgi:fimbrial chaperone protein